jgi:hypothetical protein
LDHGVEKDAKVQRHRTGLLRIGEGRRGLALQGDKDVGEIDPADKHPNKGRKDVFDEAVDHRGKRDTDDDADSKVDDIAAHDKGAEFVDPGGPVKTDRRSGSFAHRDPPLVVQGVLTASDFLGERGDFGGGRVRARAFDDTQP